MDDHRKNILNQLTPILANFEGREYSGEITRDTQFFRDLGMMSIEAILLGERLDAHFDQKIPFQRFLSGLAEAEATDITVGQLTDFLAEHVGGQASEDA